MSTYRHYRKRPIEVTAIHYDGTPECLEAIEDLKRNAKYGVQSELHEGDWCVRDGVGAVYIVSDDLFFTSHETVFDRGDLVSMVRPSSEPTERVVLIKAVDKGLVDMWLCSRKIEMATDLDVILNPGNSGTPYELMVMSELYGTVPVDMLSNGTVIGQVRHEVLADIETAIQSDGKTIAHLDVGTHLGGTMDPRREFKISELEALKNVRYRLVLDRKL